jgi:putative flippase GtrA
MTQLSDVVHVARADTRSITSILDDFLNTDKAMLLLVFNGSPDKYVSHYGNGAEVYVYRFGGSYHRLLESLYSYVYGLGYTPVFPCGAIMLSRRAAELASTYRAKGFVPLIKAIRAIEKHSDGVKYVTLGGSDGPRPKFPLWVFLFNVLLPGLLDSSLLRFLAVGVSGLLVNLGLVDAQVHLLDLYSKSYLAVPLAFELSTTWNFALNNWFTFRATNIKKIRFIEYNASTLGSFIVQFASVYLLTTQTQVHYLLASLVGIILGFFVNYTISLRIWRKP